MKISRMLAVPRGRFPGTQRWFFGRKAEELDEQLRGVRLRVLTMTEEITSCHWLKILAGVT